MHCIIKKQHIITVIKCKTHFYFINKTNRWQAIIRVSNNYSCFLIHLICRKRFIWTFFQLHCQLISSWYQLLLKNFNIMLEPWKSQKNKDTCDSSELISTHYAFAIKLISGKSRFCFDMADFTRCHLIFPHTHLPVRTASSHYILYIYSSKTSCWIRVLEHTWLKSFKLTTEQKIL